MRLLQHAEAKRLPCTNSVSPFINRGPNSARSYEWRIYLSRSHLQFQQVRIKQFSTQFSTLKVLSRYIHAQMLFDIKLYDLPFTWVEQNLDALSVRHMRSWLEMPVSACVSEVAAIPRKMGGLGISSFKHLAQKMCLQCVTPCVRVPRRTFVKSGRIW